MPTYFELPLVAFVATYIVALSGWTDTWLGWLSRLLGGRVRSLRPFSCAKCMTWWCCLAWCVYRHALSLPLVAECAALALLSLTLEKLCILIYEATLWLVSKVDGFIAKH